MIKYIIKHKHELPTSFHFTDAEAEKAIAAMQNNKGSKNHKWSVNEVRQHYINKGYIKPEKVTWADIGYLANMAYADYFGSSIDTEDKCITFANDVVNDPDGNVDLINIKWYISKMLSE